MMRDEKARCKTRVRKPGSANASRVCSENRRSRDGRRNLRVTGTIVPVWPAVVPDVETSDWTKSRKEQSPAMCGRSFAI